MPKRRLKGIIVSDKMIKTAVVKVEELKRHPLYQKVYRSWKKYKADNPKNKYKKGERVVIEECRPLSKEKTWRIIKKIEKNDSDAK